MSDFSISIVPRRSTYPNNKLKAKEILDWLVSRDIVKATPSDCILSSDTGYTISKGARKVAFSPDDLQYDLVVNGLEIVTERQVFDTGSKGMEVCFCPSCKENIAFDDCDLNPWNNNESDNLACPLCGNEADIHNYTFAPEWGFSDLGFKFWNWSNFSDEFIDELKKKLNCDISIVK